MYSAVGVRFTEPNEKRTESQEKLDKVFESYLKKLCEVYSEKPAWVVATLFFFLKKLKVF
ncbi:MAG: hypothetical protein OXL96_22710 [Candidatus Poribacteria bacterium]|nr:hypothetical protein [Candidatus Poribacteria bacterium]